MSPDYDAEVEMSDGISVISEGDGHHTPPENDATTADVEDDAFQAAAPAMGIADRLKHALDGKQHKYRALTPPPKEEEGREGVVTLLGADGLPKEKTDVESYYSEDDPQRFGIYPRHVIFLMVCCGIIGGMIGHLWNINYNCKCAEKTDELAQMYNQLVDERWDLQQTINRYENECKIPPAKSPLKWDGHQASDGQVKVENPPTTTTTTTKLPTTTPKPTGDAATEDPRKAPGFIPTAEFENLIWQHLRDTDKRKKNNEMNPNDFGRFERSVDDQQLGAKETRSYKKQNSEEDSDEDGGGVSHERFDNKNAHKEQKRQFKEQHQKQKYKSKEAMKNAKYETGSGGDNNNKNNNKAYVKQKYDNNNHKYRGGSGDKQQQRFRVSREDEESAEEDDSREGKEKYYRGGGDKKVKQQQQQQHSGEWNDKRQKGRDELRQQRPQEGEKKNWYLERGSEREINRVETSAN